MASGIPPEQAEFMLNRHPINMAEIKIIRGAYIIIFDIFPDFKFNRTAVLMVMTGDHCHYQWVECAARTGGDTIDQIIAECCDTTSSWKT